MLIEFSVANFLSIGEKQTLSMVAATRDKSLPGNLAPMALPGSSDASLMKTAMLYGPNASGKSNVLSAIRFMDWFVENSAAGIKPGEAIDFEPFLLDDSSPRETSEFEVMFVVEGVRYLYGFTLDRRRVHSEWLHAFPNGPAQRWFERRLDTDTGGYSWEFSQKHFKGSKEVLKSQTRPNALFLSTAAQFNHEQLLVVYRWFRDKLQHLDLAGSMEREFFRTASLMKERGDAFSKRLTALLQSADLGLTKVAVEERDFDESMLPKDMPEEQKLLFMKQLREAKTLDTHWVHDSPALSEPVSFEPRAESAGTLRYFSALGPWLETLEEGGVLAVDELGANIHPALVRAMLKMTHSEEDNPHAAQLIATTHDVTLLDRSLLRRDQIWFTEKSREGTTQLYPLTDFQPRKDEALAKGYLAGRYGAVPFLSGELAF